MIKTTILYLVFLILISGCSHRIVRTGYKIDKFDYTKCNITLKRNMHNLDSLEKIGEIKLGESGFSIFCSEAHALEILKNEGCALNADIINITEEKRPDLWSSCYRCRAEFYKYTKKEISNKNEEYFISDNINKRVSQDRTRNAFFAISAIIAGFIVGSLIF